jgi:outer membrane protein assembly factor BamB
VRARPCLRRWAVWIGCLTLASAAAAGSWPQFRGDAAQTGCTGSPTPADLKRLWSHESRSSVESTAAIADGKVFVGLVDNALLALELAGGRQVWKRATQGGVKASPCVAEGRVFVGDDSGVFYAADARTGDILWRYDTGTAQEILSSAVWVKDRVIFGSYDSHLYCLSARDGRLLWKGKTDAQVHAAACVAGDVALAAGCDAWLRAFALDTGIEKSSMELRSNVSAAPAFDGKRLYVPTLNGRVLAVEWPDARIAWTFAPKSRGSFYASAAVSADAVIVADRSGHVRCLDPSNGEERWDFRARGPVDSSPIIAAGRVFFGCDGGGVYGLDRATGRQVWRFDAGASVKASPAVADGRLVIGCEDGAIYCFGERPSHERPTTGAREANAP